MMLPKLNSLLAGMFINWCTSVRIQHILCG